MTVQIAIAATGVRVGPISRVRTDVAHCRVWEIDLTSISQQKGESNG